jgi:uncharacterized delta-60 repeat protein
LVVTVALTGSPLVPGASPRAFQAGSLDPSFDGDGRVVTAFGSSVELRGLVAEPDGGIVTVGARNELGEYPGPTHVVLARYRADGTLDPSFGSDGIVETDLPGTNEEPFALARRPGGGFVVAAMLTASDDEDLERPRGLLLGYRADGALDSSFGNGGTVSVEAPVCARSIAVDDIVDREGRIVAGLQCAVGKGVRFALVRFDSNGSLDRGFGVPTTAFAGLNAHLVALAHQPDDKIVALGTARDARTDIRVGSLLVRYSASGRLDRTFARRGWLRIRPSGPQHPLMVALAIQPDGKVVTAGGATLGLGFSGGFALARYTRAGKPDQSFGQRGRVFTRFRFYAGVRALVYQRGTLLAAGDDWPVRPGPHHFAVARYLVKTGKLDPRFGQGGKVTTTFPETGDEIASALATDASGNAVAGGDGYTSDRQVFTLARYKTD